MKVTLLLLGLPVLGLAFPGMLGVSSREEALQMLKERRETELAGQPAPQPEKCQLLPSLTTLLADVKGLLGSVASSVDPANYRPEPGYVYQDPKSTDSRGPCPGLNLLTN